MLSSFGGSGKAKNINTKLSSVYLTGGVDCSPGFTPDLTVSGGARIRKKLCVDGSAKFRENVQILKNLEVLGNVTVSGEIISGGGGGMGIKLLSGTLCTLYANQGIAYAPLSYLAGYFYPYQMNINYSPADFVILQDGSIVTTGSTSNVQNNVQVNNSSFITKIFKDGAVDTTFGVESSPHLGASLYPSAGSSQNMVGGNIDVYNKSSTGKIVVTCPYNSFSPSNTNLLLYNSDGTLDTNFGTGGFLDLTLSIPSVFTQPVKSVFQPDGKILVLFSGYDINTNEYSVIVARYLQDGNLDISYNGNGVFLFTETPNLYGSSIEMQGANSIICAQDFNTNDLYVCRILSNGTLDVTFGASGFTIIPNINSNNYARTLVIDNLNYIYFAGTDSAIITASPRLIKLTPDGLLDMSYGLNGYAINNLFIWSDPKSICLQPDGKIVMCVTLPESNFGIYRFKTDGTNDYDFFGYNLSFPTQPGYNIGYFDSKIFTVGSEGTSGTSVCAIMSIVS